MEVDKIGANALARMFENKLTTSKLLESEVRHFRRLSDGHADKNYQWLHDMIDKVLQLETRTKLHYKLHTVPPLAATTAPPRSAKKEKGERETRKEKEKVTNPREARDKEGDLANHLARTHHAEIAPQPLKSPAGFCSCTETAAKAMTAAMHTGRPRRRNSRSSNGPSQVAALPGLRVPFLTRTSHALPTDRVSANLALTAFSPMTLLCLQIPRLQKGKAKAKSKGKARGKGAPATSDSE